MKKTNKVKRQVKIILLIVIPFILLISILMVNQVIYTNRAHQTFENYYAFRGCVQLLQKTKDYGICKTDENQIIKIVKYQEKWYLDGDLPCGFLCL